MPARRIQLGKSIHSLLLGIFLKKSYFSARNFIFMWWRNNYRKYTADDEKDHVKTANFIIFFKTKIQKGMFCETKLYQVIISKRLIFIKYYFTTVCNYFKYDIFNILPTVCTVFEIL